MTWRTRCGAACALAALAAAAPADAADAPGATPARSHTRAYLLIATGLTLTGVSFLLAEEADDAYQRYLVGDDPAAIQDDYDTAVTNDRWSSAVLLVGQAAVALGLYWRFVQRPGPARLRGAADGGDRLDEAPAGGGFGLLADPAAGRLGVRLRF